MMPDKGLVREIDILEKLYTKCYNESKGRSINLFRNGLRSEPNDFPFKMFIESVYCNNHQFVLNWKIITWSHQRLIDPNQKYPNFEIQGRDLDFLLNDNSTDLQSLFDLIEVAATKN